MKNSVRHMVFIFIFFLSPLKLNAGLDLPFDNPEIAISMDFQDASLKDILKIFSIQSGLNFIASEGVQDRKITLYLDKVGIKESMDKLFKANNLAYELDKESNIFIVKDLGKPKIETITKVFYLKYATVSTSSVKAEMSSKLSSSSQTGGGTTAAGATGSVSSGGGASSSTGGKWKTEEEAGITSSVKKLLSENGSVVEDFRTNSLVVTDTPLRMEVISRVIASLDVPITQVMLEVEMLDVSKNVVDSLGFDWSSVSSWKFSYSPASRITSFPFGNRTPESGIGGTKLTAGSLTLNSLSLTFDYLRTLTDTKFLARPRILTLNNETAEVKIAAQESIGVTTVSQATSGVVTAEPERAETGVVLRVTPQVDMDTGYITMFVYPKVVEAVAGSTIISGSSNFQFRDPEERSTKSVVRLRDGETVVIGGLLRNDVTETIKKLPILGDIPVVGALFRHKGGTSDKNRQRELLIFITPRIIKDSVTNLKLAQTQANIAAPTAKFLDREQSTELAINRDLAINKSLNVYEK